VKSSLLYRLAVLALLLMLRSARLLAAVGPSEALELPIALGAPFRHNAVLQRGMPVPVWGWSGPGTRVTVAFGGRKKTATADRSGKWLLELDGLEASFEPREMTISERGGKSVTLKNILVGEVWMASGQSNMQWRTGKSDCKSLKTKKVDGVFPIREFEVTSVTSMLHPIEKANGSWKDGDYYDYSAIAYAFAHELYTQLKVPIGILNCSWSQTPIEAWVPREGYAASDNDYGKNHHQRCLLTDPTTPEHKQAWDAFYASLEDQIKANEARVRNGEMPKKVGAKVPGNMEGNRDASWLYNGRLSPVVPYAIRGAIWNQGYANAGIEYYKNLHNLVRGWRIVWNKPDLPVYFHQFYNPRGSGEPEIGGWNGMRFGTWLARDIPNANMASQIDIGGGIHYTEKAIPSQRLALHALKNQYPSTKLTPSQLGTGKDGGRATDLVADGPMYKSYSVRGDKVTVEFEYADGGLVVGARQWDEGQAFSFPEIAEGKEVKLFFVAGKDRVWHRATCKIAGSAVVVRASGVRAPRGVAYVAPTGEGVGLYNKAMLPMTPFIFYDNKVVTTDTWPEPRLRIAGKGIDPRTVGRTHEFRKMPLLGPQFRDNAVLQAGKPVVIWGSTKLWGDWDDGSPEDGTVIHFELGDIKKTIKVTPDMHEWEVTLPPMRATSRPRTLKVRCAINGETVHERVSRGIVFGDVIYIGAERFHIEERDEGKVVPLIGDDDEKRSGASSGTIMRMMLNHSKRDSSPRPSRYSVCVSRTPGNRFAAQWRQATGVLARIGNGIAEKTGNPVGIICMETKGESLLKKWIAPHCLNQAPSLMKEYKTVGGKYPGNPHYDQRIRNYVSDWRKYWNEYIPEMMRTAAVPEVPKWGKEWGHFPTLEGGEGGESEATQTYNVFVLPFVRTTVKAVVFLPGAGMAKGGRARNFGPKMSALANCLKTSFGGDDVPIVYTMPARSLASGVTKPGGIKGPSQRVEIRDWTDTKDLARTVVRVVAGR